MSAIVADTQDTPAAPSSEGGAEISSEERAAARSEYYDKVCVIVRCRERESERDVWRWEEREEGDRLGKEGGGERAGEVPDVVRVV